MRRLTGAVALIAAMVVPTVPAAADPGTPSPSEPVPAPLPVPAPPSTLFIPQQAGIANPLAQSGSQPGPLGLPDLTAYGPNLLLGQTAVPAEPGGQAAAVLPNLSAFNSEYLLAQNATPAAPGDGTAAPGLGPNEDIPGTGRIAFLRRLYEMYQAGALKGSLLGQQSPEEFAEQNEVIAVFTTPPVPPPPG